MSSTDPSTDDPQLAGRRPAPPTDDPAGSDGAAALPPRLDRSIATAQARRFSPWVLAGILVVTLAAGVGAWRLLSEEPGTTLEVVIPLGTGERLDNGEDVSVIDKVTEFKVGDGITITNQDERAHIVGPLTVTAGETRTYGFSEPGVLEGTCTAHPSGSVTFVVT